MHADNRYFDIEMRESTPRWSARRIFMNDRANTRIKPKSETTQQIIKRVKIATDGVSKNSIESLVRTGVHHYAQQARLYTRDDHKEVFEGGREIPITTWDSRRSIICPNRS